MFHPYVPFYPSGRAHNLHLHKALPNSQCCVPLPGTSLSKSLVFARKSGSVLSMLCAQLANIMLRKDKYKRKNESCHPKHSGISMTAILFLVPLKKETKDSEGFWNPFLALNINLEWTRAKNTKGQVKMLRCCRWGMNLRLPRSPTLPVMAIWTCGCAGRAGHTGDPGSE